MNKKTIIALLAAIALALGGIFFIRTNEKQQTGDMMGCFDKAAQSISDEAKKEITEKKKEEKERREKEAKAKESDLSQLEQKMSLRKEIKDEFIHGDKGKEYQKYIVLHDTEGSADADSVISSWQNAGKKIAAHFIVNKDGTVVQCVPLDKIAHHAGFGDTGHNDKYGVTDESRDDKAGTEPIGSDYADYGMNSYSVGIEMVHVGGGEAYPEEQLEAVDALIAYIDAYFGMKSTIIDHKSWRSGNSDTSPEFAGYLENYKNKRKHQ